MGTETRTITRKQLYELVWSKPMTKVGEELGVSDVAMAKRCRRHNVPHPPRGYWARLAAGQKPSKPPLPDPGSDYPMTIQSDSTQTSRPARAAQQRIREERTDFELEPVQVKHDLRGCHPLVSEANNLASVRDTDPDDIIMWKPSDPILFRISKDTLRRGLLLIDAVLRFLETKGYDVGKGPKVQIADMEFCLSISEATHYVEKEPADDDLSGRYYFRHERVRKVKVPSGLLTLEIDHDGRDRASGCRYRWRDGKKQRLEELLTDVVANLLAMGPAIKERKEEREAEERERQLRIEAEEQRARKEIERKRALREKILAEQGRVDTLMSELAAWKESQDLRSFIEAKKSQHVCTQESGLMQPEFAKWYDWAIQQADRLDPLCPSPASILDRATKDVMHSHKDVPSHQWGAW